MPDASAQDPDNGPAAADASEIRARVLPAYPGWESASVVPFGNGLINRTYLLTGAGGARAVLQRVNPIFSPAIHQNILAVTRRLADAGMVTPVLLLTGAGQPCLAPTGDGDGDGDGGRARSGACSPTSTAPPSTSSAGRSRRARPARSSPTFIARSTGSTTSSSVGGSACTTAPGTWRGSTRRSRRTRATGWPGRSARWRRRSAPAPRRCRRCRRCPSGSVTATSSSTTSCSRARPRRPASGRSASSTSTSSVRCRSPTSWATPGVRGATAPARTIRRQCSTSGSSARHSTDTAQARGRALDDAERAGLLLGVEWVSLGLAARFTADALREDYFGWDPRRFPGRGEHNLVRARGQWSLHQLLAASRAEREAALRAPVVSTS